MSREIKQPEAKHQIAQRSRILNIVNPQFCGKCPHEFNSLNVPSYATLRIKNEDGSISCFDLRNSLDVYNIGVQYQLNDSQAKILKSSIDYAQREGKMPRESKKRPSESELVESPRKKPKTEKEEITPSPKAQDITPSPAVESKGDVELPRDLYFEEELENLPGVNYERLSSEPCGIDPITQEDISEIEIPVRVRSRKMGTNTYILTCYSYPSLYEWLQFENSEPVSKLQFTQEQLDDFVNRYNTLYFSGTSEKKERLDAKKIQKPASPPRAMIESAQQAALEEFGQQAARQLEEEITAEAIRAAMLSDEDL